VREKFAHTYKEEREKPPTIFRHGKEKMGKGTKTLADDPYHKAQKGIMKPTYFPDSRARKRGPSPLFPSEKERFLSHERRKRGKEEKPPKEIISFFRGGGGVFG